MHIMVDLETMGRRPCAPIVSIGAVGFDARGVHREFYTAVSLESELRAGATVDANTILWWMQQDPDAVAGLLQDPKPITQALADFRHFVFSVPNLQGVWGNGAAFDNVILAEAYERTGVMRPWQFWQDRCYRTIKSAYPDVELRRTGTHHNALDDARTQAEHLMAINEAAGGVYL